MVEFFFLNAPLRDIPNRNSNDFCVLDAYLIIGRYFIIWCGTADDTHQALIVTQPNNGLHIYNITILVYTISIYAIIQLYTICHELDMRDAREEEIEIDELGFAN